MKRIFLTIVFLNLHCFLFSQQWNGSNTSTGVIYREGNVGIGTSNPTENLEVVGTIKGKGGIFESIDENLASNSNNYDDWFKYSRSFSIGRITNLFNNYERRFNFYDLPSTSGIFYQKSAAMFTIKDIYSKFRFNFIAEDIGETRFSIHDKFGKEIVKTGNLLPSNSNNPTNQNISFLHLKEPNSRVAIGTWVFSKPDYQLTVNGKGWFSNDIVTSSKLGVGVESIDIPIDYNLAVNGKIICEEVKVQLFSDWPDYVFNKDYYLPSLYEVYDFIGENGHLKDVPSAEEVKQNGINLGEIQVVLLKKIEELTLYTINQQKIIDTQNSEIREINQKYSTLLKEFSKLKGKIELEN